MIIGKNCKISDKISVYENEGTIMIGDNVRIDDFCILSTGGNGSIKIGNHVHVSSFNGLYGGGGIVFEDFVQIASRCLFLSASDDFSGHSLVGPCIPKKFKPGLKYGKICLEKHALVGAGSIILPNVTIGEGSAIGAASVVKWNVIPWAIYAGIPAKLIKYRNQEMKRLAKEFIEWYDQSLERTIE